MNLLIIGGTKFLGRHLVDSALRKGHQVTLFNRGKTNPGLFDSVEKLIGDRDGDLDALTGRKWDTVIDTCGYYPRIVKQSVDRLADSVRQYIFISSLSVYADFSKPGYSENAPVGTIEDETIEEITEKSYGPLKALCEEAVESEYGKRALIIRPGLIVGPHDPSDRFTYWVRRMAGDDDIAVPKPESRPVQVVDVRDLADWIILMAEKKGSGIYNATGPDYELSMKKFLGVCRGVGMSQCELYWIDEDFLLAHDVKPWTDIPIWVTGDDMAGFLCAGNQKAIKAGLKFRPLIETIKDTLAWDRTRPKDYVMKAGLGREKETAVLEAWYHRSEIA